MLRPLNEFEKAIKSRPIRITGTHLGLDCGTIIAALNIEKNEAETAIALVDYWKIVPECEENVRHQAVESLVSRALLMLLSSKAYSWVVSIATEAIQSPTKDTWVGRLTKDVQRQRRIRHLDPTAPPEVTFNSKDYLPSMSDNYEATVTQNRWMLKDEDGLRTIRIVSFIIETWLQFPTSRHQNSTYKVKCALISVITKYMPLSILLLEEVWQMYLNPYRTVIHGENTGQRIQQRHTDETLKLFEESIQKHAMVDSTTKEHQLLQVLNKYSETYHRLAFSTEKQKSMPNDNVRLIYSINFCLVFIFSDIGSQPTGIIDTLETETIQTKMSIFSRYLQDVKTILVHGPAASERSKVRTVRMVAKRPDFRLPFRQKAPTMKKALDTIYSDRDRLRTPEGFWNVLTFRGVTYGSPYAEKQLQWFDTYDEWADYYARSKNTVKGNKQRYFVDVCAYGFNNKHRKIENIKTYWEERAPVVHLHRGKPRRQGNVQILDTDPQKTG